MIRTKTVSAGGWRTLEWFWNQKATAFFRLPAGAQIKIRYGDGWPFGADRQKQTLDGSTVKRLAVGAASLVVARLQMKVSAPTSVTYDVYPGQVVATPPVPF